MDNEKCFNCNCDDPSQCDIETIDRSVDLDNVVSPRKSWYKKLFKPIKYFFQRKNRGFDDTELWNLDVTFAEYIVPRLKAFRKLECGHPDGLTQEEWNKELDEMIWYFEFTCSDDKWFDFSKETQNRKRKALKLFAKRYENLWW